MRIIRDFTCPNGHTTEKFIDREVESIDCPDCTETAKKIISPVTTMLNVTSGDFPGATAKWLRGRDKQIERERKAVANHGDDAAWDIAKNR
tara:strand:+ start:51 stop:323 length:273 start_codon:yes stop_codon:yes gene_type:complete